MRSPSSQTNPPPHRRRIVFLRGFQLRYVALVAGSLVVLLLFTGLHGLFVAQLVLPPEISSQVRPVFEASTWRVFFVGILYVGVVALAAIFLSHRTVGPIGRLQEEIEKLSETTQGSRVLKIREGDELAGLAEAINKLIEKRPRERNENR